MVSTLTVGTNTYILLVDADAYLEDSIASQAWSFLDDDTKGRALVTAFRMFEKLVWQGDKTVALQTAEHPRTELTDCNGVDIDSSTVAQDIVDAQVELAYALTQNNSIETSSGTGSNNKKLQAGSVSIEFFNSTDGSGGYSASRFPQNVQDLLKCYLEAATAGGGAEAFGTGGDSLFDSECDKFNRSSPF